MNINVLNISMTFEPQETNQLFLKLDQMKKDLEFHTIVVGNKRLSYLRRGKDTRLPVAVAASVVVAYRDF